MYQATVHAMAVNTGETGSQCMLWLWKLVRLTIVLD